MKDNLKPIFISLRLCISAPLRLISQSELVRKGIKVFVLILALSLTSCGYRAGIGDTLCAYRTISVPYVEGDWNGALTSEIVKDLSQTGRLAYRRDGGSLILNVTLLDVDDENIGFRHDRTTRRGKLKKEVIPIETRLIAVAEVEVVEACSGRIILGPVEIVAYADFDHDFTTSRNGINVFSLGQVTDFDEARDAAYTPLNRQLARKIVDFVNNSW
jgi:hypothetical protein